MTYVGRWIKNRVFLRASFCDIIHHYRLINLREYFLFTFVSDNLFENSTQQNCLIKVLIKDFLKIINLQVNFWPYKFSNMFLDYFFAMKECCVCVCVAHLIHEIREISWYKDYQIQMDVTLKNTFIKLRPTFKL